MTRPTRKDRDRVNMAWALLIDATDRMGHSATHAANTALASERKARGVTNAKALMVETFVDGYTRAYTAKLSDVSDLSAGLLMAAALGVEAWKRRDMVPLHPHTLALAYECKVYLGHVPRVAA